MKAYEITFSPTGGTKKVADILLSAFTCEKAEISLLPKRVDYSTYEFSKEDICLIAVPSFGGRVPETATERLATMKGNSARAVLVCVYGNRAYEDTLPELKNIVKQAGFCPICAVTSVAEHSIMRQFASGRPDTEDIAELEKFAEVIWEKLVSGESLPEVQVPGNEEYRKYGVIPLHPMADKTCSACGLCAGECPVGAIDPAYPAKVDERKCISCMRCVSVCPQGARCVDPSRLEATAQKMAKAFETRKGNEIFWG